jgi:hypothetical protein
MSRQNSTSQEARRRLVYAFCLRDEKVQSDEALLLSTV